MKKILSFGVFLVILSVINGIQGDIEDNEVQDGPGYTVMRGIKVYPIDRQCAMVGGLCVQRGDCREMTSTSGLCPTNHKFGVECCYELNMTTTWPTTCAERLGECMNRCNPLLMRPASDCRYGQVCCVLTK